MAADTDKTGGKYVEKKHLIHLIEHENTIRYIKLIEKIFISNI